MKIMTWNILASEWIKKSYYPNVTETVLFDRKNRFKRILEKIILENPDVLMLQEVMQMEYKLLSDHLRSRYHVSYLSPINWSKKEGQPILSESGNITLLKKSVFKSIHEQPLPGNFGLYSSALYSPTMKKKSLSKSISKSKSTSKTYPVHLFNIHLHDLFGQTRTKQMNVIKPFSEQETTAHCILAGDFNQEYNPHSKLYAIPGFTVHNKCKTYYIKKNMNIDNILSKGFKENIQYDMAPSSCLSLPAEIETGFKLYGSDHLPVIKHLII
jgi:endonuclease/exonuclease/phosphatase family metal-dependent hydrolase